MDSNRIKRLATGAREELMREVEGRLDAVLAQDSPERLSDRMAVQRLDKLVEEQGRESVIEAGAYTWFNRLCALRFMDANGYAPTLAVTPREGSTMPAVLADATQGAFDPDYGFSAETRERIVALLSGTASSANPTEAAYAEVLKAVCDRYAAPMPYLFSEDAASSLLMPQGLLSENSILRRIVAEMDEETCSSVEVLGWLYQFYIAERKDEVFAGFKKNKKAGPDEIGPATQLFTPEWIVRYLCENSLGHLWMINNPGSTLAAKMDYYIDLESDEPHIDGASAEEIRVLDPACGSGHILVYAFDLLFKMYEEEGWLPEDIPAMILRNNLKGLEIDARAAEIAKFALEMKALERDSHFLEREIDADIVVLRPVALDDSDMQMLSQSFKERVGLIEAMAHMGEVGSLYYPTAGDIDAIRGEMECLQPKVDAGDAFATDLSERLSVMLENVEALSGSYHCVVANPPYMGSGNMNPWLSKWCKENYPDEKNDLCTCFINRGLRYSKVGGLLALITASSWMFISSFETMRKKLIENATITSMIQQSTHGYANVTVPTCMFALSQGKQNIKGSYIRLEDFDRPQWQQPRSLEAIRNHDCGWFYRANAEEFKMMPGTPIVYWASRQVRNAFESGKPVSEFGQPRQGLATGKNALFVRYWWEVSQENSRYDCATIEDSVRSHARWFPYNKGGEFRKWYGNNDCVIDWEDDGKRIREYEGSVIRNPQTYFSPCITWSKISSGSIAFRWKPAGHVYDVAGTSIFADENVLKYLHGAVNSSVILMIASMLSPTLNFEVGQIASYPIIESAEDRSSVCSAVDTLRYLSQEDWDSFETSWDFEKHPLVSTSRVADAFAQWESECRERFDQLKSNEEELNRIFARIYSMEGEAPIEVPDDKVSVRLADLQRDIKSLISYGVGCILGRYSLDLPGLVLADQGATVADYLAKVPEPTLMPDEDNVLPVLDAEWFDDDVVTQLYRFLAATYGEETLDENVTFVESALGCDLRTYLVRDFYADHVKTYQKRPIYWLFQSPKKSFSCLVYMHRYNEGTVGELLTKYLRTYEEKLRLKIQVLGHSERAVDLKTADRYRAQLAELEAWEKEVIYPLAHERVAIDLDDGVKVNYNKFPHALAKIQGLSEWR